MAKLPWFPFYATDWVTDPRVLGLSNEQRGIFHWLLCRQWMDGDLPGDVMHIYPLLPPGSDSAAVSYILTTFFPADPDTNRRSNPRLEDIRQEQEGVAAANKKRTSAARAKRWSVTPSVTESVTETESKSESKTKTDNNQTEGSMDFHIRVAQAANSALKANPHASRGETDLKPLRADLARSVVEGWVGEGIPESVILGAISRVCGAFRSTPENPRISSWRYFEAAVRKDWLATKDPVREGIAKALVEVQGMLDRGEL